MNNWAALDEYAFRYVCDAYYLNVDAQGRHEFKLADASWDNGTTFGGLDGAAIVQPGAALALGRGTAPGGVRNLEFHFTGEHTLRVAFVGGQPTLAIGPKSFADPREKPLTNPIALSLAHDSRALADRSPFGAVKAGTAVEFAVNALRGVSRMTLVIEKRRLEGNQDVLEYREVERVGMVVADGGMAGEVIAAEVIAAEAAPTGGKLVRWGGSYVFGEIGVYGYYFEAEIDGQVYVYQNNRKAVHWTREQGSNGVGLVDEKPESARSVRRYRLTVYRPDYVVPEWAGDAVYYYIFPDRFRNGDRSRDPKPGVDKYHDKTVEFHQNWLDRPYKPGTGDGSDPVHNNDFFGGDIAGIIEKLDYIAALGANTLYITPLFTAASNHKYDTADYRNIDPHFGDNEDFVRLTAEAARRGLRVIPDASLNHTGQDSIYFDRFANHDGLGAFEGGKIQAESPYADWYTFDANQSEPDKQYKGWVGVIDLPELNKASPGFREFAYGADDSVMKQWLDRGAAGWRMDVAPWVPDDFWREWRTAIKQHRPDALTIAETWFDASKFFLGDSFDSTMNYIFRNAVIEYANGGKASEAYRNIEYLREVYPPQSFHALMNVLSTHDVPRSLHLFGYQGEGDAPEIVAQAKQRLRLAVFFQMIFPGAPAIYYGDEVGVTGAEDPFNRATYPWADRGGTPDLQLLAEFKRLIAMRKDNPVLRKGVLLAPLHVDDHVIVLARQDGGTWAITATNNARAAAKVTVRLPGSLGVTRFRDALTGEVIPVRRDGTLELRVPASFGTALVFHRRADNAHGARVASQQEVEYPLHGESQQPERQQPERQQPK
ncbi:MAG: glycoside hydrolase family 13 protein [Arenimonas sp.]